MLLGWSLVGWIVALVLSLTSEPRQTFYVNTAVYPVQQPLYGPPATQPAAPARSASHPPAGRPTAILPPHAPALPPEDRSASPE